MWTRFYDMHTAGSKKTEYSTILVEAPEAEAKQLFEQRFDVDPTGCSCDCCGDDYWINEYHTLAEALEYTYGSVYILRSKS